MRPTTLRNLLFAAACLPAPQGGVTFETPRAAAAKEDGPTHWLAPLDRFALLTP